MSHHLAQLNIARMRFTIEDPRMADFVANLDTVNGHAERSPGFVWRMVGDTPAERAAVGFGADMLVNLSVWASVEPFRAFVASAPHLPIMRRRAEWFERMPTPHAVLWWVLDGHRPSLVEARQRLDRLAVEGPSPVAFTLGRPFDPPAARAVQ